MPQGICPPHPSANGFCQWLHYPHPRLWLYPDTHLGPLAKPGLLEDEVILETKFLEANMDLSSLLSSVEESTPLEKASLVLTQNGTQSNPTSHIDTKPLQPC